LHKFLYTDSDLQSPKVGEPSDAADKDSFGSNEDQRAQFAATGFPQSQSATYTFAIAIISASYELDLANGKKSERIALFKDY
jgi:hypothetical protein